MSDTSLRRTTRTMAVAGAGLGLTGLILMLSSGGAATSWQDGIEHNALVAVAFGVIVWVVGKAQPRNRLVVVSAWVSLLTGIYAGVDGITWVLGRLAGYSPTADLAPADLPTGIAMAKALTIPASIVGLFVMVTFGILLLFPDGRPPSPRWRYVGWMAITGMAISTWSFALAFWPTVTISYQEIKQNLFSIGEGGQLIISRLGLLLMIGATLLSAVSFVVRWRHSEGQVRQQLKWVGAASVLLALTFLVAFVLSASQVWTLAVVFVAAVVFAIAYGAAIVRYRLYDIDLVISRAFVYGTLGVFITAGYVGIVVGLGPAIGGPDNAVLSLLTTALVAIVFQPLRRWLQRVANRLIYGKRATPYEVLSDLARRVGALDENLLVEVARSLVEGTGAESAGVWVASGAGIRLAAAWPEGASVDLETATATAPVSHDGERLGALTLSAPAGQRLDPNDERLLSEVAAGMGLALRNLELTEDLRARVSELRASRRRIVAVQDETRRRLERDLHDGAQQQLVALKVKLGLARSLATADVAPRTSALLDGLSVESDTAIEAMRDFARGVYPPLLGAEGLTSALTAHARKLPIPVRIEAEGIGRYPRDVEATVYFCVLEALQNVALHARATRAGIRVREEDGAVSFEVSDDGVGFDHSGTGRGAGLTNMADRLDAVEGTLDVVSVRGQGTTVRGWIPVMERVAG
jgi:signal transduction histidine kinase